MRLCKYTDPHGNEAVGRVDDDDRVTPLDLHGGQYKSLAEILEADNPQEAAQFLIDTNTAPVPMTQLKLRPPIDTQEVWAAGVTYKRSQAARMEESEHAANAYDRVYESPRPELFFKATPHRVAGHGQPLRIRSDSKWNVPEPELTLVINSRKQIVGYTIGNDMSSRDIEGENPLYLPQAKVYDQCCGLGPCITLPVGMPQPESIRIEMAVRRNGQTIYHGHIRITEMARSQQELVDWLSRDNSFPAGAFLLTGTGIVPDKDFTLQPGDYVDIAVPGIGILTNPIVQG